MAIDFKADKSGYLSRLAATMGNTEVNGSPVELAALPNIGTSVPYQTYPETSSLCSPKTDRLIGLALN